MQKYVLLNLVLGGSICMHAAQVKMQMRTIKNQAQNLPAYQTIAQQLGKTLKKIDPNLNEQMWGALDWSHLDVQLLEGLLSAPSIPNVNEKSEGRGTLHQVAGRICTDDFIALDCELPKAFKMLKLLLEAGANPNMQDDYAMTPLLELAGGRKEHRVDAIQLLIDFGAHVNKSNKWGVTALMFARNPKVAKLLINNGAWLNTQSDSGSTPLIAAMERGESEVVKVLIEEGAGSDTHKEPEKTVWFERNKTKIEKAISEGLQERDRRIKATEAEVAQQPEFIPELAHIIAEYVHGPQQN